MNRNAVHGDEHVLVTVIVIIKCSEPTAFTVVAYARRFSNVDKNSVTRVLEKVGNEAIRPAKSSDFYGDCGPQGPLDRTMSMRSFRGPSDDDRKRDFAKAVAAHLERNFNEGTFDRLVLVAPPQTLGDLKGALPTSLRARVICNIQRNLMHAASFELAGYLGAAIRD